MAGQLSSNVGEALSSACRGDSAVNEGAYRLVRKGSVASEAIASGGYARTVREVSGSEEVLAAEDTTTLSWSDVGSRELGDLGGPASSKKRGFMVHSFVAVRLLQLRKVFVAPVWMPADRAESNERRSNKPCTEV